MFEKLKEDVYEANMLLPESSLVIYTWGNVSGITEDRKYVAIKPSGVDYAKLTPDMIVVVDMQGKIVDGDLNPSSDLETHLEFYEAFPSAGGVVHTHSRWATIWAQAARDIPDYGTTHADYFFGPVPVTRALTEQETEEAYERNTGKVIVETFRERQINPEYVPGVLVSSHGPFTWGKNPFDAVHNAVVLEELAMMAWHAEVIHHSEPMSEIPEYVKKKHFLRKHGPDAYYGQKQS
ncbi:MAG: L-ribulose-5-phosphate 4-epimerase [Clostridia bacterium]|nr:L-ribulose-5-phosphate 4-epimerase [Clostridia bacterium]